MNKAKRFAAVGLVSGLMVFGACQDKKPEPTRQKTPVAESCSLTIDPVKRSGIIARREIREKMISGHDVSFDVKEGDIVYREDFIGFGKDNKKVKGHTTVSVAAVDDKGILLKTRVAYCGTRLSYYRVKFKAGPWSKYVAQRTSNPEMATLTIRPGIDLSLMFESK